MKVRNIIRKAAVLGSSAALVGTTLMGALAYDLGSYPSKFIADGQFDGKIVVGEHADTPDVLGAIDIAASLQSASVKQLPGDSGEVDLVGQAYELTTGSDGLELREPVGQVADTVSGDDLEGLESGHLSTGEGDTEYHQYLRFRDGTNLQDMAVNYVENDDDVLGDYLVVDTDKPFLEWEIQFTEGLESEVQDDRLEDLEDRSLNILGQDFTIVKAQVDGATGNDFELTLMGGSVGDSLREGETKVYEIGGQEYEVTLVFVSDPNSGGEPEAKFSVNGELTQALGEGDTDTLSGGLQVGARDILVNSREGVASFYLGAKKVVLEDGDTDDADDFDGSVEIDNDNINDGEVTVLGSVVGTDKFEVTSIKYRVTMDAEDGSTAYVPAGHGVREFMKRPDSLISESLDVKYEGLLDAEEKEVSIEADGDDEYHLRFTNIQGREYEVPLLANNGALVFGDGEDDLVFTEGASPAAYTVQRQDYFIVSNDRGAGDADKSVTNVLRYEDYDNNDYSLELEDVATGQAISVPIDASDEGKLVIGGHTYKVYVDDRTLDEPQLALDLNADGDVAGDEVGVTAWGGLVLDLNAGGTPGVNVVQTGRVLAKNFDTSNGGDETFDWTVQTAGSEVDLDFNPSSYSGPLAGTNGDVDEFRFSELDDNDDVEQGMTDYGILVEESDPSGSEPNELSFSVPKEQRLAQVFVTLGDVEAVSAGSSEQVNPIGVGLAVLDKDVTVGDDNLIVVGGPCANTVAASLLDNPVNCVEGFEPGKSVLKAFDTGSKVAILVAGYDGQETLAASRVLAKYKDYDLSGGEVEIVSADLHNIVVHQIG